MVFIINKKPQALLIIFWGIKLDIFNNGYRLFKNAESDCFSKFLLKLYGNFGGIIFYSIFLNAFAKTAQENQLAGISPCLAFVPKSADYLSEAFFFLMELS